jgi:formamidopyrimidine-DNA glycosylase
MPEQPEIEMYLHALGPRIIGAAVRDVRVTSFSLLRTYDPGVDAMVDRKVEGVHRIGKRISIDLTGDLHCVIHLMVAGRFRWNDEPKTIPKRGGLAAIDFSSGSLLLTEAGTKRRASMSILRSDDLESADSGGIEILDASLDEFKEAFLTNRHTLKRALTDAHYLSGVGGAFGDEILFRAHLSPTQMNTNLSDNDMKALYAASQSVLEEWTDRLIDEVGDDFPKKVTAFHPAMAVHGKFGEDCKVCGAPIQRIVASKRETNYCPGCQTEGRILADRSLSRLLKDDWPKTLDEL